MPVNRDEFEGLSEGTLDPPEGTDPRRVLTFLDRHAEQAYTRSELSDATGISEREVGRILARLEELRLVVNRGDYWAIDQHRIGSLAAMSHGFAVADDRYPPEDFSEWKAHAIDPRK